MNRWKLAGPIIACAASLFTAGCAERVVVQEPVRQPRPQQPVQVMEAPPPEVYVDNGPPPEQVEVIPQAQGTDYVWIKGHWHWNGGQWVWTRGRYEVRRVGYRWVPAHYEQRGNRFVYVAGYWGR